MKKHAYFVNKLRQNVGLEIWLWRQMVTSQTAHTKYKWLPYVTEWNPHENFLRTPLIANVDVARNVRASVIIFHYRDISSSVYIFVRVPTRVSEKQISSFTDVWSQCEQGLYTLDPFNEAIVACKYFLEPCNRYNGKQLCEEILDCKTPASSRATQHS